MVVGQITLNTVPDAGMINVIQAKDAQPGLVLAGAQISPTNLPGNPPKQGFNNVTLTWTNADGLKALAKLLEKLAELA